MSFPCIHSIEADRYAEALGEDEAIMVYADEHGLTFEQAQQELERQQREDQADRAQAEADWEAMWP